jgi:hypothetical protein
MFCTGPENWQVELESVWMCIELANSVKPFRAVVSLRLPVSSTLAWTKNSRQGGNLVIVSTLAYCCEELHTAFKHIQGPYSKHFISCVTYEWPKRLECLYRRTISNLKWKTRLRFGAANLGLTCSHIRLVWPKLTKDEHSSLFCITVSDKEKKFHNFNSWAQCYKTYQVRNLWFFIISCSVCPWQVFSA